MSLIEVKDLVKNYKIIEKEDGLLGYLKNLIKPKYKEFTAVNNINFNINEGELVGYIGENGAGKSTTIKMLTGLLTPTSGQVVVNGIVPNEKRIENNKNIGAVFGQKTDLKFAQAAGGATRPFGTYIEPLPALVYFASDSEQRSSTIFATACAARGITCSSKSKKPL